VKVPCAGCAWSVNALGRIDSISGCTFLAQHAAAALQQMASTEDEFRSASRCQIESSGLQAAAPGGRSVSELQAATGEPHSVRRS